MIFILHYVIFNVGLPPVIMLMTLFLQTHSRASLSEIGALLMALPFVSIGMKPLFCALADRHQAHRQYLMASLTIMALGYGSLSIAPFFPDFIRNHHRLVWYLDILAIIIGYGAFGVAWSLGDTLAVNGAAMAGVSWGSYRMWSVVSWGVSGAIIGQLNELTFLPRFVPGMLMMPCSAIVEIVLLAIWPRERFVMGGQNQSQISKCSLENDVHMSVTTQNKQQVPQEWDEDCERHWPSGRSLTGTLNSNMACDSLIGQPQALSTMANIIIDDVSDTIKSTLKRRSKKSRIGLDELLAERSPSIRQIELNVTHQQQHATTALDGNDQRMEQESGQTTATTTTMATLSQAEPVNIQLILLKLIVRRDRSIWKYLFLFTLFGALMMCHIIYFFINVSKLCQEQQANFALISGAMMMMHALGEVTSFLLVDQYIRWSGRVLALATCALIYLIRFSYYSFLMAQLPIGLAIPFEICHGLAYAILYSILCNIATECINQVDDLMPELIEHGLVSSQCQSNELKAPLRATMQGVFSGAFDGLGNGLGALFGGLFLNSHSFAALWQICAGLCLAILVIYPLTERHNLKGPPRTKTVVGNQKMDERREQTPT